ncbi:uncharacterized protein [Scyliorhinus torazame]|uniref:uncharacterized protein n=1 Tax=Scyliorhinus torazame TaxID=75743 RepID=UPI003B5C5CAC
MAESASELCGELGYRSGERRRFAVRSPCTIPGILSGVRLLQQQLRGPLTQLVLREKELQQRRPGEQEEASTAGEYGDDDDEDVADDEDDSEDELANKGDGNAPPAKKTRNQC